MPGTGYPDSPKTELDFLSSIPNMKVLLHLNVWYIQMQVKYVLSKIQVRPELIEEFKNNNAVMYCELIPTRQVY